MWNLLADFANALSTIKKEFSAVTSNNDYHHKDDDAELRSNLYNNSNNINNYDEESQAFPLIISSDSISGSENDNSDNDSCFEEPECKKIEDGIYIIDVEQIKFICFNKNTRFSDFINGLKQDEISLQAIFESEYKNENQYEEEEDDNNGNVKSTKILDVMEYEDFIKNVLNGDNDSFSDDSDYYTSEDEEEQLDFSFIANPVQDEEGPNDTVTDSIRNGINDDDEINENREILPIDENNGNDTYVIPHERSSIRNRKIKFHKTHQQIKLFIMNNDKYNIQNDAIISNNNTTAQNIQAYNQTNTSVDHNNSNVNDLFDEKNWLVTQNLALYLIFKSITKSKTPDFAFISQQ
jgi:hypothetical protein